MSSKFTYAHGVNGHDFTFEAGCMRIAPALEYVQR
jgi:hypothetical protein